MTETIGPYAILDLLGEGGMGRVHRAQHVATGERVALKTVHVARRAAIASVRREIRVLAALDHPGVVRVLDHGLHHGSPWYAMELLSGASLRDRLEAVGVRISHAVTRPWRATSLGDTRPELQDTLLDLSASASLERAVTVQRPVGEAPLSGAISVEALRLVAQLCETLAHLHGEGVVHRDVKPENVLVRDDGQAVLVDFGLAEHGTAGGRRERVELIQGASGTALYMAPEQIQGGWVDARADLYALGCILYEIATGAPPFTGDQPMQILSQHLGAAPLSPIRLRPDTPPALDALIMRLLEKRPSNRPGYAEEVLDALVEAAGLSTPSRPRRRVRPHLYRSEFVGRHDVFEALLGRCRALARGEGNVVLIEGEAGVGKSRLAMELGRAGAPHIRLLSGACAPRDHLEAWPLQALQPTFEAVADAALEGGRPLGEVGRVLATLSAAIARLPELEGAPPLPELPPREATLRRHVALTDALERLARDRPVLLILDDLQWADPDLLAWLEHLTRAGLEATPLLVLGLHRGAGLEALECERLEVSRLERAEVERMVGSMLGWVSEEIVDALMLRSGGNPRFVVELLRGAVEEGVLVREAGGWRLAAPMEVGLPERLLELLRRRLSTLIPSARALAERLAVFGQILDGGLWSALDIELPALDALLDADILAFDERGDLSFTHHALRELLCDALEPRRLAALHRDAAVRLEALSAEPASIARHWEQAGEAERARAAYWAAVEDAGDDALMAIPLLEALLRGVEEGASSERLEILDALASRCIAAGDMERSGALAREALDLALALDADELARDAVLRLSTAQRVLGEQAWAAALLDAHEARFAAPPRRSDWLRLRGELAMFLGDFVRGLRLVTEAEALSRAQGEHERSAKACIILGGYHLRHDDFPRAFDAYHRALELPGVPERERALIQHNLGLTCQNAGHLAEARAHLEAALAVFRAIGDRRFEAHCLSGLATVLAGEPARADAHYRAAIEGLRALGDRRLLGTTLANYGHFLVLSGEPAAAEAHLEAALPHLIATRDRRFEGITRIYMAEASQALGRLEEAEGRYRDALRLLQSAGAHIFEAEAWLGLAVLYRRSRQSPEAERALDRAEALFAPAADTLGLGSLAIQRGHLRLALGEEPGDALEVARGALASLGEEPELERACAALERAIACVPHERLAGEDPAALPDALRRRLQR